MPESDEQFLTVAETAKRLKLANETVRRLIRDGHLRAFRVPGGRHFRIPLDAIEELVKANEQGPPAEPAEPTVSSTPPVAGDS